MSRPSAVWNDIQQSKLSEIENRTRAIALLSSKLLALFEDETPDARERRILEIERVLDNLCRDRISARLDVIASLPFELVDLSFGLPSFQQWMLANPREAAAWMSSHPAISEARLLTLFQHWGENDRNGLGQYLSSLPEGPWKQKAVSAASYEALPNHPTEALTCAAQLDDDGQQTSLLKLATIEWAKRDPVEASRWVSRVNDLALRDHLLSSLALGYSETDPSLAGDWSLTAIKSDALRTETILDIATSWLVRDKTAALDWIKRLPGSLAQAIEVETPFAPTEPGSNQMRN
ncbi:MAG: hypothetical protein QM790_20630 [Nibricoccus sp.]